MAWNLFKRAPRLPAIVRIQPTGAVVQVPANQSMLQAILDAGVVFPHSCKVGTCKTCRCLLISGKVKPIRDFSYILSGDEIRAGYILACQSKVPAGTEAVVEVEYKGPWLRRLNALPTDENPD